MQEENFETLEADLQVVKQEFAETKYVIYETGSFNVFLERLSKNQFTYPQISLLNKEAKDKLKAVKQSTSNLGEEIKDISELIYKTKEEILSLEEKEKMLEKEIKELELKNLEIEQKESEQFEFLELKEKLNQSEKERETFLEKKLEMEKELGKINLTNLQEKVKVLTEKKEDLADQEKAMQKDKNDLEDLYLWYKNGYELTEKLFGYKYEGCRSENSFTFISLSLNNKAVQLVLEDNNLKDIIAEDYDWINDIKDISIKMNDPRIFLLEYKKNMK